MGMFNIVDIDKTCPNCGSKVEWQSKEMVDMSNNFIEPYLDHIKLEDIQIGEIHTLCDNCKKYYKSKIKNGKIIKLLEEGKWKDQKKLKRIGLKDLKEK